MEPIETKTEASADSLVDTAEVTPAAKKISNTVEAPVEAPVTLSSPASSHSAQNHSNEVAPLQTNNEIWEQVTQKWDEYFGEGKKSNLTIAIAVISSIPLLVAASALLDFLNKLPLLPSVFELVGFGYSAWFVYRYLLLANTRKELIDVITAWKNQVFG